MEAIGNSMGEAPGMAARVGRGAESGPGAVGAHPAGAEGAAAHGNRMDPVRRGALGEEGIGQGVYAVA